MKPFLQVDGLHSKLNRRMQVVTLFLKELDLMVSLAPAAETQVEV